MKLFGNLIHIPKVWRQKRHQDLKRKRNIFSFWIKILEIRVDTQEMWQFIYRCKVFNWFVSKLNKKNTEFPINFKQEGKMHIFDNFQADHVYRFIWCVSSVLVLLLRIQTCSLNGNCKYMQIIILGRCAMQVAKSNIIMTDNYANSLLRPVY